MEQTVLKQGPEEGKEKPEDVAMLWCDEIRYAKQFWKNWENEATKLDKRYRAEDNKEAGCARFNMFWSEIQVLQPAVYARSPKAQVERRFKDNDPIGKVASEILERATQYSISSHQDFDLVMRGVRDDYLIPGRGTSWERYIPHLESKKNRISLLLDEQGGSFVTTDGKPFEGDLSLVAEDEEGFYIEEDYEDVTYEESVTEFVPWCDFLCSSARNWEEVRWAARKVHLTKKEIVKRFGEKFADVPLDYLSREVDDDSNKTSEEKEEFRKACIWEIWDKVTKKIYWISEHYPSSPLDVKEDTLNLKDFFPCPRPLLASTTSTTIIPRADFLMAQDQAQEVDLLTERITKLIDSVRVNGVYDEQIKEDLTRVLFEGDNQLSPMRNYVMFASQGGFEGSVQFMPFDKSVQALRTLYEARERAKQDYYEVSGKSDIMRGATDPRETLGAQNLKAGFGNLRLREKQEEMQRFVRDVVRIKSEIIAEHFSPNTLRLMSGIDFLPPEFPGTFEQAVDLLRNDPVRCFRVEIETDSTINLNEDEEKQRRTEFLQALGGFLKDALPMAQQFPPLVPVMQEGVLFLVRGFRVGREMEGVIERSMALIGEQAQEQQSQQDPSAMMAMQQQQQVEAQAQAAQQAEMQKLQMKYEEMQAKMQLQAQELRMQQEKVQGELLLKNKEIEGKLEAQIVMNREKLSAEARTDSMEQFAKLFAANQRSQAVTVSTHPPMDKIATLHTDSMGRRYATLRHVPKAPEIPEEQQIGFETDANGQRIAEIL